MCSKIDRMKLTLYEYFLDGEPHSFLKAVNDLEKKGIHFSVFNPAVDEALIELRKLGQLKKVRQSNKGGDYQITDAGLREYEERRVYAGVA